MARLLMMVVAAVALAQVAVAPSKKSDKKNAQGLSASKRGRDTDQLDKHNKKDAKKKKTDDNGIKSSQQSKKSPKQCSSSGAQGDKCVEEAKVAPKDSPRHMGQAARMARMKGKEKVNVKHLVQVNWKDKNTNPFTLLDTEQVFENWQTWQKEHNLNRNVIKQYVKDMKAGKPIEPILVDSVQWDEEEGRVVIRTADGRHRLSAARELKARYVGVQATQLVFNNMAEHFGIKPH